eukprot:scaffold6653_cov115-Isochrysis_galbana.AAC.8
MLWRLRVLSKRLSLKVIFVTLGMAAARSWASERPQQSVCRWCRCCPATARPGAVPLSAVTAMGAR